MDELFSGFRDALDNTFVSPINHTLNATLILSAIK